MSAENNQTYKGSIAIKDVVKKLKQIYPKPYQYDLLREFKFDEVFGIIGKIDRLNGLANQALKIKIENSVIPVLLN